MSATEVYNTAMEINVGGCVNALAFSANGDYLISGGEEGVQVWEVNNGKHTTTMKTTYEVYCLAVSKDGKYIAAGTKGGQLLVWDANTHRQVFKRKETDRSDRLQVTGVDFSPTNSNQLVSASVNKSASIWDVGTRKRAHTLRHDSLVHAAKYSPLGERVATATHSSVRVYDCNNGRLVRDIRVSVVSHYDGGLLWSLSHLLVISHNKITKIDASTGTVDSECPVPDTDYSSCISIPKHRGFVVYSSQRIASFWDTVTHAQLGLIQRDEDIFSISVSPDDSLIAIGGEDGRVSVRGLSCINGLDIQVDQAVLDCWKQDQLVNAHALLTASISESRNPSEQALAIRALIRARLCQWDAAIDDATESVKIRSSVIGYIAKCVALVGNGERRKAYRACDIAFGLSHSTYATFLLLIKAIIVFMAGEPEEALFRLHDLIGTVPFNSICCVTLAYMLFLTGKSHMESGEHENAIQSFQRARSRMGLHASQVPLVVLLVSGWKFDDLDNMIRQYHCEALYAAGRVKEAGECLISGENIINNDSIPQPIAIWASDFLQRCLSSDTNSDACLSCSSSTPLLKAWASLKLASGSWRDALAVAPNFTVPKFVTYQALCENLETTDHIPHAIECLNQMSCDLAGEGITDSEEAEWTTDFMQRCTKKLEHFGDIAAEAQRYDEAITQYSTALSLDSISSRDVFMKRSQVYIAKRLWGDAINDVNKAILLDPSLSWGHEKVMKEWAKINLTSSAWSNALNSAREFEAPRFTIYQALCERLISLDHITDAAACFLEMVSNLEQDRNGGKAQWFVNFQSRCGRRLEEHGDLAMGAQKHDEAISHYSDALSLDPVTPLEVFRKRCNAYMRKESWGKAVYDASQVITLDQFSPWGYERKCEALRHSGYFDEAVRTFEMMLSMISQSPDPNVREQHSKYVNPARTKEIIREAIDKATRESPLTLINTDSGRLLDKSGQMSAFETQPIFSELISSMTTQIDYDRIENEVSQYYRYAMFSHKWEANEPLFENVVHIIVHNLEESPTHHKLKMFCNIARELGFHWAWSDTCCINKANHFVLQEALVSMFKWYESSAMTIVLLRGVRFPPMRGDLVRSIWNTRVWTLQEYHASKVVRFYTEDWKPYLSPDIQNHKESPEIIAEMEKATGVSARALVALQPGLDDIREKLRLASSRDTTRVEDEAYSLLGIFAMSLPVVYGEGDKSLGRLLAQVLTSSGDTSILAWTGQRGSFNSCLPSRITVFKQLPTTHIPQTLIDVEINKITAKLQSSSLGPTSIMVFHDRLEALHVPLFAGQRLRLPCIAFKLGRLSTSRDSLGRVFRAQTGLLGIVEIKSEEDLSQFDSLYLIHPWVDFLLNRQPVGSAVPILPEDGMDDSSLPHPFSIASQAQTRAERRFPLFGMPFGGRAITRTPDTASLPPPSTLAETERQMRALQVLARLKQPFGALLLTPHLGGVAAYRRVATESLITVTVEEITLNTLNRLIESVRILDVL